MCELEDLYAHADIESVTETARGETFIEAVVRKTGSRLLVVGDDLADAADQMMRLVEDQVFTLDAICRDYHLSVDDIRALVNAESADWGTSQYGDDEPWDFVPQQPELIGTNLVTEQDMAATEADFLSEVDRGDTLGDLPANLLDHAILATPLELIAAQPFLAIDRDTKDLYLALRLPRPDELPSG